MSSIRFRAAKQNLVPLDIAAIRRVCDLSISEIQRRALASEWLFEIPIFSGEWPKTKPHLVSLLKAIQVGDLPLLVSDYSDTTNEDELLSITKAFERLQYYREIALEQDMLAQLEMGYISKPEEYEPPNEDEA